MTALRLFGVTVAEGQPFRGPDGVRLVTFRELAAVVADATYQAEDPSAVEVDRHRQIIDAVYASRPVVPAPVGVIFRSAENLTRWMELHYVSLSDALAYIDDRAEARVHICRANADPNEEQSGTDIAAAAAESFRALRRRAVGAFPLRTEHLTGIVLSSAFLVDKELWSHFIGILEQERDRNPGLEYSITGPWPPYDFVRMRFAT